MKKLQILKSNEIREFKAEWEKVKESFCKYVEINNYFKALEDYREHGLPDAFLKDPVWVEWKRSGSNLRAIHLVDDKFVLGSRNMNIASDGFINKTVEIGCTNMLEVAKEGYIVFYEIFGGKEAIPPCFGLDSDDNKIPLSIEVIDLFDVEKRQFMSSKAKRSICEKHDVPVVPLVSGVLSQNPCKFKTYKELDAKLEEILEWCKTINIEGVVCKADVRNYGQIRFKHKTDIAKIAERSTGKIKQKDGTYKVLPTLEDSEIWGAISKSHAELDKDIFDTAVAMPKVAYYVRLECEKHDRAFPKQIYNYYLKYLKYQKEEHWTTGLDDVEYEP